MIERTLPADCVSVPKAGGLAILLGKLESLIQATPPPRARAPG